MNLDQETFLTAYLDGELDAGQGRWVESALQTDARLGGHLRDLGAVRDLVANLPRPSAPVDAAALVLARLRDRQAAGPYGLWRDIARWPDTRLARVGAAIAAAAAVILLAVPFGLDRPQPRPDAVDPSGVRRPAPTDGLAFQPTATPDGPTTRPVTAEYPLPAHELRHAQDQLAVRDLLDHEHLGPVFKVTASPALNPVRQVDDLLAQTSMRQAGYGRLAVSQEVAIDPEHPGDATVFVVVLDDGELGRLRSKLLEVFQDAVRESKGRPEVVTQLADVGPADLRPGVAVADLLVPEGVNPAIRDDQGKIHAEVHSLGTRPTTVNPRRRYQNGEAETGNAPARSRPIDLTDGPPRQSLVLIWVSRPRPAG